MLAMYYLNRLLPTLLLVASIDARAIQANLNRRYDAAPIDAQIAAENAPTANPYSCGQSDTTNIDANAASINADTAYSGSSASNAAAVQDVTAMTGAGARAIYFMTNQDDNSVIMLPVQEDGTLAEGSIISTGGKGGVLIDAMTNAPVASDSLASQGAVRVVGNSLFAVNAGSNSLSMFAIDSTDPAKLTPVGQPAATGGDVRPLPPSLSPFLHICSISLTIHYSHSSPPPSPPPKPSQWSASATPAPPPASPAPPSTRSQV